MKFLNYRPYTNGVRSVKVDRKKTFFLLNSNKIYCNINTANRTEKTTFIKFLYKANEMRKHLQGD